MPDCQKHPAGRPDSDRRRSHAEPVDGCTPEPRARHASLTRDIAISVSEFTFVLSVQNLAWVPCSLLPARS
jgi:hypothetical protein